MYHALLTNRYLTSRVIPLIAVAAVALCVALVIIVVSVMTGFLDMVRSSGRTLMGDVIISFPVAGIPHYKRLIERIEQLSEAEAATPVVDSWGLLRMPYPEGPSKETETVQFWGIEPAGFARVTGYDDTIYWRNLPDDEWEERLAFVVDKLWGELRVFEDQLTTPLEARPRDDYRRKLLDLIRYREEPDPLPADPATLRKDLSAIVGEPLWSILLGYEPRLGDLRQAYEDALTLRDSRSGRPAIVLGIHVSAGNQRQSDGSVRPMRDGLWWMPQYEVTLTTLPINTEGGLGIEPEPFIFPVVNEFLSGVFLIDDKRVMIPIEIGQRLLHLSEGQKVDPDQLDDHGLPTVLGVDPARATMVLVRAAEGVAPDELRQRLELTYDAYFHELAADETAVVKPPLRGLGGVSIRTWEQQQAQFIEPIEKERELMRTLFSLVYLVCAGLVLSIFWAIVYEKTRDIGILRSIGASRFGISWIFLRYGLVIGIGGAIVGLGLAYLIVHNINTIHSALGDPPLWLAILMLALALAAVGLTVYHGYRGALMPITLGALVTITLAGAGGLILLLKERGGVVIWDPAVYYFTEIPNRLDRHSAVITMIGAVLFSLIGAFLPAAKAADTNPVKALRYE
jgi:lipoprotein-releasing system permease protein